MEYYNFLNINKIDIEEGCKIRLADFMNFNISAFSMRVGKAFIVG